MRRQPDTHTRTAQAIEPVLQRNGTAVISDNPVHNCETKTCAFFPRGHIRLQQTFPNVFWKTRPIIFNGNFKAMVVTAQGHSDLPLDLHVFRHAFDRFRSIFQQIADRLTDQPLVASISRG